MMFKTAGIVLIVIFAVQILKKEKSEYAFIVEVAATVGLLLFILPYVSELLQDMKALLDEASVRDEYLKILLKCSAIALLSRLLIELCRDAGENALTAKVELCAKVFMLISAFPVFESVLMLIQELLEKV
ncbi:MAG: hypothetical protein IKM24_07935 [Clostridia bacterium]|nr:hypothetical protein [Clostridia bacterium]